MCTYTKLRFGHQNLVNPSTEKVITSVRQIFVISSVRGTNFFQKNFVVPVPSFKPNLIFNLVLVPKYCKNTLIKITKLLSYALNLYLKFL